ncbi:MULTISPECIES: glucuronate isomerase [unclassified Polaribacter]|uniref:glucuronate isomerase n=1 Tax=unclassified Polaribacter TaxID=196858 RepID=UPI0011BF8736|nr:MULTISPECIES: glucuronate isomerase [unclassified Polaribacter]TXD50507.1 glucuronate isomerase [Polaribacter sp. IC063]TXD61029.1 glucuronate isomerase [Polaribacter sp. IC066]
MNSFITNDFLLRNDFAIKLYHNYAKSLPIIDYHNHLAPQQIAEDKQFENITQVWLSGDHYKWRAMRAFGINEKYITGTASDKEKFLKWAEVVPFTIRNPLFHWTHLELKAYFGIDEILSPENAEEIYEKTSELLQQKTHSTNGLLKMQNVESLCTTDDPIDSLEYHIAIQKDASKVKTFPTFRPDKSFGVEDVKTYNTYLLELEKASAISINSYTDLLAALENRVDFFNENGCRLSDHGLEQLYYFETEKYAIADLFDKVKAHQELAPEEVSFFKAKTMIALGKMYHKKGWTQQLHLGAIRNNNKRLLKELGPDTGFDSIGDFSQAKALSGFLNALDSTNQLTKTIVYNLNPSDNEVFATMVGNFNDGTVKGKVQFGAAWWFLDQKDGMEKQINTLSNQGLLTCFVGMLTDSRSFLSFPRHDYFRRILCNIIGTDVENGELPNDEKFLGSIISDICYYNAQNYFNFK